MYPEPGELFPHKPGQLGGRSFRAFLWRQKRLRRRGFPPHLSGSAPQRRRHNTETQLSAPLTAVSHNRQENVPPSHGDCLAGVILKRELCGPAGQPGAVKEPTHWGQASPCCRPGVFSECWPELQPDKVCLRMPLPPPREPLGPRCHRRSPRIG